MDPRWAEPLAEFFNAIAPDESLFHPHPLTRDEADRLAQYEGDDLYYVAVDDEVVLGYGLLRGWDEGFDVPSLGIALRQEARRTGLARCFMEFLHAAARRRGAHRIRLTVEHENAAARRLYEQLGYDFAVDGEGRLVGTYVFDTNV